jgi:hypothetical protein
MGFGADQFGAVFRTALRPSAGVCVVDCEVNEKGTRRLDELCDQRLDSDVADTIDNKIVARCKSSGAQHPTHKTFGVHVNHGLS